MANTFKFGNENWAVKDGKVLAYNDENNAFKPLPFTFARSSSATRVDNEGLIKTTDSGFARIDFTNNTSGHLLLEPSSTNLVTHSEDFSDSSWTKLGAGTGSAAVVTSNYAVSPDGTQNASRLQCDLNGGTSSSGNQSLIYDTYSSSSDQTISIYVKSNNGQNQTIYFANTQTSGDTIIVTSEWQRFTFTHSTSTYVLAIGLRGRSGGGIDDTADVLIWGSQAEASSFATSYIPTTGSTVTRAAETCNSAGNSTVFNDSEGVLYAEIAALTQNSGDSRRFTISDGSIDNRVSFELDETEGLIKLFLSGSGTTNTLTTTTDVSINFKIAASYNSTSLKLFLDGTQIGADTSVVLPTGLNVFSFNNPFGGGTSPFYGKVKGVAVFKEALTDIELEKLTSWRDFRDLAESLEYTLVTIKSDAIVVSAYGTTSGGGGVSGGGSGGGGGY